MAALKQRTVDGTTYKLKQYSSDRPESQYEYVVEADGRPLGDPLYTRDGGEEWFRGVTGEPASRDPVGGGGGVFGGWSF